MTRQKYYFDVENWEYTVEDKTLLSSPLGDGEILQMGVFERLSDVFLAKRHNVGLHRFEEKEFATREEAQAWIDSVPITNKNQDNLS